MGTRPIFKIGFRWLLYFGLLFIALALQTQRWMGFKSIQPIFILPVCLGVALYEGEFSGALFGAAGGLLWDIQGGRIAGFFAIQLMIICFFTAIFWQLYLRDTIINFILITGVSCLLVCTIDYLIFYYLGGYFEPVKYYIGVLFPSCILTAIFAFPFRWITGKISEMQWESKKKTEHKKLNR